MCVVRYNVAEMLDPDIVMELEAAGTLSQQRPDMWVRANSEQPLGQLGADCGLTLD